jgi:hypothetical protein
MLVDEKGRERVVEVIASEFDERIAVLAREGVNELLCSRRRRPLSSVGSSGAAIAIARTRRARRNAVFLCIRLFVAKHGVRELINGLPALVMAGA